MRTLAITAVLLAVTSLRAQSSQEPKYPQLVSTQYADRAGLPASFKKPTARVGALRADKSPEGKVLSQARSAGGHVWLVTEKGAFREEGNGHVPLEAGPTRFEPGQPRIPAKLRIVEVASDLIGVIWAATNAGLLVSDGDQWWQFINRRDGVPYEDMTSLHLAKNGDVWGGTTEGAWRLRSGEYRYFWGKRWLPGNKVLSIWTDDSGVWLETDGGFAHIEEKSITLSQKASHFDTAAQARHNRRGFINEIHLQVPGDPSKGYRYEISDNDGLWNSIYVGAMAFRYAATKDPAARRQAQQSMEAMLELERLTGISGYPARAIVTEAELKQGIDGVNFETTVRVPGETDKIWFRSPVDPTVWCKGDTSSDEMDGHYFAWYLYHDLVADAAEKQRIAAVVRRATDHILEHNYTLVGHTGRKTRWGIWAPELINLQQFYVGMRPLNSLEILTFLKIAEHITRDAKYTKAADGLINKHHYLQNTLMIRRGRQGTWPSINHSDDEMLYMMYYALLRLEKSPERRRILEQSITRSWETNPGEQGVRGEHSPLYNYIYGATTGKPCDADQARQTLQDWPLDMIHWTVKNSHRHDVTIKTAQGPSRNRTELDRVLPASERRLSRWNGNPWAADGGSEGHVEDDGAAWALAYWLGVYHGFLPKGQ